MGRVTEEIHIVLSLSNHNSPQDDVDREVAERFKSELKSFIWLDPEFDRIVVDTVGAG